MKVIFLDIDGVLNQENWMYNHTPWIDEYKLDLISFIATKTGAKVVMSSNWRETWNEPMFYNNESTGIYLGHKLFKKHNIPLIGFTKIFGNRGDEIMEYVHSHPEIDGYVAIDDSDVDIKNFVKTNSSIGITNEDALTAIALLA